MPQKQEYVGLAEAARLLGISRATAYTWALAGRIPAVLILGRYAVSQGDLETVVSRETAKRDTAAATRLDKLRGLNQGSRR